MKQRKKHKGIQGYALLYGRSSKAIRIVNGEVVGKVEKAHRPPKTKNVVVHRPSKAKNVVTQQPQKKYKMSEDTKRRIDNLQDPLDMMSRNARTQKYESLKSREKYEYGLSDW